MKKRTKTITYDPNNYENTRMAGVLFANKNKKIKKTKTVETPRKIKVVEYGPMSYYGKQTKKKTIIKKKK